MKKLLPALLSLFCSVLSVSLMAQNAPSVWSELPITHSDKWNLDDSIQKYRTGFIIVKTTPGTKVESVQQKHEFWFGCALNSNAFDGKMDEQNARIYKQKFLENFNAGVTASSLKWHHMEPEKGKVDFLTTDNILAWADENHLPLRGHNLYWGIYYVQDWVKALNDEQLHAELHKRAATIAPRCSI